MEEIFKRRSYHGGESGNFRVDAPIPDETIDAILKAGMNAPSAMNSQPWQFVVVDDRSKLEELSKLTGGTRNAASASHVILVCGQADDYAEINAGIATENIVLDATYFDVASLIMGIYPNDEAQIKIREIVKMPGDFSAFTMIALGYSDETLPPNDRWLPEKIHRNDW